MRLFIAIEVPENIIKHAQTIQKTLKMKNLFIGTYQKPKHMHITVAFLGEQTEKSIPSIISQIEQITTPSFEIELSNVSFDDQIHPHVIWIDLLSEKLELLATTLAKKLNIPHMGRAFKGHLTVARIKKIISLPDLKKTVDSLKKNPLSFTATKITLYESTLTSVGPVYKIRHVHTLT